MSGAHWPEPSLVNEFQTNEETLCQQNTRWTALEKQRPRLTCSLHIYKHTCASTRHAHKTSMYGEKIKTEKKHTTVLPVVGLSIRNEHESLCMGKLLFSFMNITFAIKSFIPCRNVCYQTHKEIYFQCTFRFLKIKSYIEIINVKFLKSLLQEFRYLFIFIYLFETGPYSVALVLTIDQAGLKLTEICLPASTSQVL